MFQTKQVLSPPWCPANNKDLQKCGPNRSVRGTRRSLDPGGGGGGLAQSLWGAGAGTIIVDCMKQIANIGQEENVQDASIVEPHSSGKRLINTPPPVARKKQCTGGYTYRHP